MTTARTPAPAACYIDRFSPAEKALMRIGLYGLIAVGVAGIYAADPVWAWGYLAFAVLGFMLPVVGILCARCPYPYTRHTCLFVPYGLIPRMVAFRPHPMKGWEKAVLVLFFAGLVVWPLPFLAAHPLWLVTFLVLALPTNGAILVRYCPRCRNVRCPFNRVRQPTA